MYFILSIILLILCIDISELSDPCESYIVIDDEKRSAGYEPDLSLMNVSVCDSFLNPGWYRSVSKAGHEMPNSCPLLPRCNSMGPLWLNMPEADKPTANTTTTKQACLSGLFSCCEKTYDIEVRNCYDEFFIYNLVPTTNCPETYCFGTQSSCEAGQYSESGFTPGCGPYPDFNSTGDVVPGLRTRDQYEGPNNLYNQEVIFTCDFIPNNIQNFSYDVYWYINDKSTPIKSFLKVQKENLTSAILLEEHWTATHRMNMVIWCSTRVRENDVSSPSPHFWSLAFTAGLKFDKDAYAVQESESISVGVEITVPIPRAQRSNATPTWLTDERLQTFYVLNAVVRVPLYQFDATKTCNADGTSVDPDGLVFRSKGCGLHFTPSNWKAKSVLNVTGKVDNLYNQENRITAIRLKTLHNPPSSVWNNITVPDVKVVVIDKDYEVSGKMCNSYNDPHIKTIEGSAVLHHFIPGEFILFKSTRFPYQVNAVFRSCNRVATCHCGVAVKNADGLFVINMCPQHLGGWIYPSLASTSRKNRYVEKRFCDDTHMTMTKEGSNYRITLPTGTDILISVGQKDIRSVLIKPSVLDYNNTVGLCGSFGVQNNQYILLNETFTSDKNVFFKHYAVKSSDSLFSLDWQPSPSDFMTYPETFCICREEENTTPVRLNYILCNLTYPSESCISNVTDQKEVFYTECSSRRKRSTDNIALHHILKKGVRRKREVTFEENAIEKFSIEEIDVQAYEVPVLNWTNGWTEDSARLFCESSFYNTSAYDICSIHIQDINITSFVTSCIMDIKVGGDTSYVDITLDAYKSSCVIEATRMEVLQKTNSSTIGSSGSIFNALLETTCPNDCSGNGTCHYGECQCHSGFIGADCSQGENSQPLIDTESMSGICDTTSRSCETFLIYGSGFNPYEVLCAFREIQIYDNNTIIGNSTIVREGHYMNDFCIQCVPPISKKKRSASQAKIFASGYMISVANGDGSGGFTDEISFMIFDSSCYDCNVTSLECKETGNCLSMELDGGIDPCINYTSMTDDVTRSVAWVLYSGQPARCDFAITEQWYRIESAAGNDIASSCPPTYRCGTNSPVWMNGSIPNAGVGIVEMDVCVSGLFDCCESTWKIRLKNCGNFISYYLPPTTGCPQAYCFGTLLVTTTTEVTTPIAKGSSTSTRSESTDNGHNDIKRKVKTQGSDINVYIVAIAVTMTIVGVVSAIVLFRYFIKGNTEKRRCYDTRMKLNSMTRTKSDIGREDMASEIRKGTTISKGNFGLGWLEDTAPNSVPPTSFKTLMDKTSRKAISNVEENKIDNDIKITFGRQEMTNGIREREGTTLSMGNIGVGWIEDTAPNSVPSIHGQNQS